MAERRVLIPHELDDTPPPAGAELYLLQGETMGTTWSLRVAGPRGLMPEMLRMGVERQLASVIAEMSPWEAESHVSRFNRAEAGSWHTLPADFFTVLATALELAESSDGAFDPAIGALVDLWGFGPAGRRNDVPGDADIAAALKRGGWQRLQLDEAESRALQPGGVALDFSGIAKGFAVDKVSDYLLESGFPSHLMEIGGELKGRGLRPDGHPWWVQLEAPTQDAKNTTETIVALHELAVASSGDYRKFFQQDGRRHAHTLDPRSGRSVDNGLAAVSVLHEQCMLADAQATVLMVLGLEAGMAWAVEQGVAALFVTREGEGFSEHLSPALGDLLE